VTLAKIQSDGGNLAIKLPGAGIRSETPRAKSRPPAASAIVQSQFSCLLLASQRRGRGNGDRSVASEWINGCDLAGQFDEPLFWTNLMYQANLPKLRFRRQTFEQEVADARTLLNSQRIPEFTILPCQMLPATRWEQPIQRLAFGIMSTALSDSRIHRHQYGLRLWLRSHSNAPFSFFGICEILGLDVQATRDALIARIAMRRRNPSRSSLPGLLIARPCVL
jgi:hypothetical protein